MAVVNPSHTVAGRADTIRDARAFVRDELDMHVDDAPEMRPVLQPDLE